MNNTINEISSLNASGTVVEIAGEAIRFCIPFLPIDKKSEQGRTYPRALLARAIAQFNAHAESRTRYGGTSRSDELTVNTVSHMIERLSLRDNYAVAHLRILPTTRGTDLATIIRAGGRISARMRATGRLDAENVCTELVVHGVDVCLAEPTLPFGTVEERHFYESLTDNALGDATLQEKYRAAIIAGYSGTFEQYKQIQRRK